MLWSRARAAPGRPTRRRRPAPARRRRERPARDRRRARTPAARRSSALAVIEVARSPRTSSRCRPRPACRCTGCTRGSASPGAGARRRDRSPGRGPTAGGRVRARRGRRGPRRCARYLRVERGVAARAAVGLGLLAPRRRRRGLAREQARVARRRSSPPSRPRAWTDATRQLARRRAGRRAPAGIRTRTVPGLSRLPLPVGLRGLRRHILPAATRREPPADEQGRGLVRSSDVRRGLAPFFALAFSAGEPDSALRAGSGRVVLAPARRRAAWAARTRRGTRRAGRAGEPSATTSRRSSSEPVQPAMMRILRFTVGMANTWYVRCRTHAEEAADLDPAEHLRDALVHAERRDGADVLVLVLGRPRPSAGRGPGCRPGGCPRAARAGRSAGRTCRGCTGPARRRSHRRRTRRGRRCRRRRRPGGAALQMTRPILSSGRSEFCSTGLALTPAVQTIVSASNSILFDSTTWPSTQLLRNVDRWISMSRLRSCSSV